MISEERLENGNGAVPVHTGERCFQLVGTASAKSPVDTHSSSRTVSRERRPVGEVEGGQVF